MNDYMSGRRLLKHWDFILLDGILIEAAFLIAYSIRFENSVTRILKYHGIYRHQALILVLCLIVSFLTGHPYKNILKRDGFQEIYKTLTHTIRMMVLDIICLFFIHEAGRMSRYVIALNWVIYFVCAIFFRTIWKRFMQRRYANKGRKNAMILLTQGESLVGLINELYLDPLKDFFISAIFLVDYQDFFASLLDEASYTKELRPDYGIRNGHLYYKGIPIYGGPHEMLIYANHNWVDEAMLDNINDRLLLDDMASTFEKMGITSHTILTKLSPNQKNVSARYVERISNYVVSSQSMRVVSPIQVVLKRMMDIAGGIVGCLITGIVFIFIAPMIYIKSPGPIFFKQTRVGKNGKLFQMYKFRSMYMDAEARKAELMKQNKIGDGMMFKMDDDPRIIGSEKKNRKGKPAGIGNFIRNTSLDEFPQFWNVLKGDMSLVGTRPPTLDEWEKYDTHHRARMSIRPGITGMWQISGRSNIVDFETVVALDTKYIQTWTIGLDIQILAKTVVAVIKHEGAE